MAILDRAGTGRQLEARVDNGSPFVSSPELARLPRALTEADQEAAGHARKERS